MRQHERLCKSNPQNVVSAPAAASGPASDAASASDTSVPAFLTEEEPAVASYTAYLSRSRADITVESCKGELQKYCHYLRNGPMPRFSLAKVFRFCRGEPDSFQVFPSPWEYLYGLVSTQRALQAYTAISPVHQWLLAVYHQPVADMTMSEYSERGNILRHSREHFELLRIELCKWAEFESIEPPLPVPAPLDHPKSVSDPDLEIVEPAQEERGKEIVASAGQVLATIKLNLSRYTVLPEQREVLVQAFKDQNPAKISKTRFRLKVERTPALRHILDDVRRRKAYTKEKHKELVISSALLGRDGA